MSLWDFLSQSDDQSRTHDRWSHPCSRCSGGGSVMRNESIPCGCFTRCSDFCSRKTTTSVSKSCTHCNGTGIEP